MHVLCELLVLRSVGFVYQHEYVVSVGKNGVFRCFVVLKLVYQRKHHGLVATQKLAQLGCIFGLALFLVAYYLAANEGFVYLRIEVFSVCNNKKGEVAVQFSFHLSNKHHHRIALARPLRMPENAQLSLQFFSAFHTLHQVVYAEILVVFCYNLGAFVVEEDEVFDVVEQAFFA